MKRLQITDNRIQEAIVLYKSGITIKPICKQLHLDGTVLRKFLIDEGILKTRSNAVRSGKSDGIVKDDALEVLTSEALYWIGFLYADGHIEKQPRNRIALTLAEVDYNHLEKFANFFGQDLTIRDVTQKGEKKTYPKGQINFDSKYWRVAFSSVEIYNRLVELGFSHNKTLSLTPHELLKMSRDFWRGVIDGDGTLYYTNDSRANGKYNTLILSLSGTYDTNIEFLNYLKLNNIFTEAKPINDKRANVWETVISDVNSKAIKLLYKDATVYLERKYQKYLKIINSNN